MNQPTSSNVGQSSSDDVDNAIELAEMARAGRRPPRGRKYLLSIDGRTHLVEEDNVTGRQLLDLAEKQPADDYVVILLIWDGENEVVGPDDNVDLARRGIERFITGRKDDEIVVAVYAPRSPEPKDFIWDSDLTVGEAAQEAADAFGYDTGSPGLQKGDHPLDRSHTLEEADVEHGNELELFDTGGGV